MTPETPSVLPWNVISVDPETGRPTAFDVIPRVLPDLQLAFPEPPDFRTFDAALRDVCIWNFWGTTEHELAILPETEENDENGKKSNRPTRLDVYDQLTYNWPQFARTVYGELWPSVSVSESGSDSGTTDRPETEGPGRPFLSHQTSGSPEMV